MTITPGVREQLLGPDKRVVQLPPRSSADTGTSGVMTVTTANSAGYYHQSGYAMTMAPLALAPIATTPAMTHGLPWTAEEHARFILGLEQYPAGPWKLVAAIVGSRDARQTMSHAQKYRMKIHRRKQKEKQKQQHKHQRQQQQRQDAPSAGTTSTNTDGDDGRPQAVSEIAISTTSYAAHSLQALDLSVVSSALSVDSDAAFAMSTAVKDDKFGQSASARMSPLAFDAAPMPEMTTELHEFLCSDDNSVASAFDNSYESHIE